MAGSGPIDDGALRGKGSSRAPQKHVGSDAALSRVSGNAESTDLIASVARGEPVRPDTVANAAGDDRSAELLSAAFESLPVCLVVFDRTHRVLARNEAARLLLPDDDDICIILSKLTAATRFDDWALELSQMFETHVAKRFDAMVRPARDQADVFLSLACSPLRDATSGAVTGGVLLAEDVSSRVNMEQRLAVSERLAALGKLAARVAHELNNPLDGILRYVNLAIRVGQGGDADVRVGEYLEKARGGLMRMTQITTALLEFSRSAHAPMEQATINKIVEDAITAMAARASEVGVTVVCNLRKADFPVMRGSNIFQVFCNLIKNAIDAMPDGGTLTVTTSLEGPDVVIAFEDTGIGLPVEAERIFEPFFTTKEPGRGTGLGLAVCREIIERYGGSITAHRRKPAGTAFIVRIPERNCGAPVMTLKDESRQPDLM